MMPARILATTLCLVAVAALSACATEVAASAPTSLPSPTATVTPTGDGVLRIGTLMPNSGPLAFLGASQAAAVALAASDINAAGGVNGAPVEVIQGDSGDASTTQAETALASLVSQGVDVIVGPSSSALAERLLPSVVANNIAMISPAATLPALGELKDSGYFFRTIPSYESQGFAIAKVISKDGPKKVGYVYVSDDLGIALKNTLAPALEGAGSTVTTVDVLPSTTDFASAIAEITKAAPDLVVLSTSYASFDTTKGLITQLLGAGYTGGKLWLTTQNTGDYSQALPNGTLNGVNGIIEGYEPDDAFKARLKALNGNLSTFRYSAEAYDATVLAALAAIVAGDDGGKSVASALVDVSRGGIKCTSFAECVDVLTTQSDIDYDGISGPLNFTPDGEISPAWYGIYSYNGENKFVLQSSVVAG